MDGFRTERLKNGGSGPKLGSDRKKGHNKSIELS
jgi:hypothetical protein